MHRLPLHCLDSCGLASSLITMYSKCERLEESRQAFEAAEDDITRKMIYCNILDSLWYRLVTVADINIDGLTS
jgi:uncharacterized protein YjaG (DUF416 family)